MRDKQVNGGPGGSKLSAMQQLGLVLYVDPGPGERPTVVPGRGAVQCGQVIGDGGVGFHDLVQACNRETEAKADHG